MDLPSLSEAAQFITACTVAYNVWQTWRNGRKTDSVAINVKTIEIATNHMKDALVAATAKASLAEGTAVGLAQGRSENVDLSPLK